MIKIYEKDVLFCGITAIAFLAFCMHTLLDFLALYLQIIVASDPIYSNLEVGFSMIRAASALLMIAIASIALAFDSWWLYRLWKSWSKAYWRDNL